ncbi:DUF1801 domain-containing protein [Mucilaginibacter aquaedulcis]|jgi:hypothetical protein|uniref:DUF1801 domain-containing protein n=1 Tax=Mucilaginibacter aquaedulcis TaxID=1187081 RepID=UPI0025B5401A|nr:DUF1801 domain-containing protein [Mucilaginibacter aquaedulcis]MDN3551497.1 DUF1801 domain-containing protein [Mucilaginibacter aquaedulcis]
MAQNKTTENTGSVTDFLNAVADDTKRTDSFKLVEIMEEQTGYKAKMWGPAIVGFGSYHYKYESGREGDAPMVGFSPRKAEISIYLMQNPEEREALLANLGKYKTDGGCIRIKKLQDINTDVLRNIATASVKYLKEKYPA